MPTNSNPSGESSTTVSTTTTTTTTTTAAPSDAASDSDADSDPTTDAHDEPPSTVPYTADSLRDDKLWYGHLVESTAFVYDSFDDHVYTVTDCDDGYTFTLTACATAGTAPPTNRVTAGDTHYVDNICDFAGAYEASDLIPLPTGELRVMDGHAFLAVGEFVLRFPGTDIAAQLRDWLDETDATTIDIDLLRSRIEARAVDTTTDDLDVTVYHRPTADAPWQPQPTVAEPTTPTTRQFSSEDLDIKTGYVQVGQFSKWTFDDDAIKTWVEGHLDGRVLNACAGTNRLQHDGEIVRNDSNPDRPADLHVDVAELAAHLSKASFDVIVFDPPWSLYQSNLRYDGHHVTKDSDAGPTDIDMDALPFDVAGGREKSQLGHARLAKENFDYLLKPGGTVIQLTFHGTNMPGRLGYKRCERIVFDPTGEAKSVIGSVDQKTQRDLAAFV